MVACQEEGVCMPQIVSPSTGEVFLSEHLVLFVIVYSAGFVCLSMVLLQGLLS